MRVAVGKRSRDGSTVSQYQTIIYIREQLRSGRFVSTFNVNSMARRSGALVSFNKV